jgi:hypothetical protein
MRQSQGVTRRRAIEDKPHKGLAPPAPGKRGGSADDFSIGGFLRQVYGGVHIVVVAIGSCPEAVLQRWRLLVVMDCGIM